jgi:uncharacterized protein YcbK (DUF882 family)
MSEIIDNNRRRFLQMGLIGIACAMATPALAVMPRTKGIKRLAFHNLHTDEKLQINYWKDGDYDRPALQKINSILRDFRTGDIFPVRPSLLDLVHDLQAKLNNHNTVEIISAYRSPKTNDMLCSASDGVARNSLHMQGMAIDMRLNGTSLRQLQTVALFMQRGGVGYYPDSGFVHVDVGRIRRW